jgi:hypothetical protein
MPPPKAPRRNRKPRKVTTGAKTKENSAAASRAPAPSDIVPEDMTVEDVIRKLYEDRERAIEQNRAAAAVQATVAIARLLGMLPDKPGRTRANLPRKLGRNPPLAKETEKFDGNYNDAARRIAFLLGLGKEKPEGAERDEEAEKAETGETANQQKRGRPA